MTMLVLVLMLMLTSMLAFACLLLNDDDVGVCVYGHVKIGVDADVGVVVYVATCFFEVGVCC